MNIKHNQWEYTEVKEIFYLKRNCHLELKSVVSHHHYVIFSRRSIKICQKFSFYIRKVNNYLLWNETFSALWSTSSVQLSLWVMSNSWRHHGLQHVRPPSPSPTPGVYSDSCLLSWWCHPTISSSVIPFSCYLQFFPASGSFLMSQFFHQVDKLLTFQLQHQSFQWIFRTDFL